MRLLISRILLWLYSWVNQRKSGSVVLGGKTIAVKPMNLEQLLEFLILIGPYLMLVDSYYPEVEKALKAQKNEVLFQIFKTLSIRMTEFPSDTSKMLALLAGVESEWLAENATPAEIVTALPVFDQVHQFSELIYLASQLKTS